MSEKIYIGADHAGFSYKDKIKKELNKKYNVQDLSPKFKEGDDFPDVAFKVAEKVSKNKNSKGVLICGSGAGMVIAANKVKGIRAVEIYDKYSAKMSREHNDANIATFGERDISFEKMKSLLNIWLKTKVSNEERHHRRIREIVHYENKK
jgi:ribose 5-phosphate isomerase B